MTAKELREAGVSWAEVFQEVPIKVRAAQRSRRCGCCCCHGTAPAWRRRAQQSAPAAGPAAARTARLHGAAPPPRRPPPSARRPQVHNPTLIQACISEYEPDTLASQSDFDRLSLSMAPFMSQNMEALIECVDDIVLEQQKVGGGAGAGCWGLWVVPGCWVLIAGAAAGGRGVGWGLQLAGWLAGRLAGWGCLVCSH